MFCYCSPTFIESRCHILNAKSMSHNVAYDFVISFVSLCKIINCWLNTRVLCIYFQSNDRPFIEKFDHFEEEKSDQLKWHMKLRLNDWIEQFCGTPRSLIQNWVKFRNEIFSKIAAGQLIEYEDCWHFRIQAPNSVRLLENVLKWENSIWTRKSAIIFLYHAHSWAKMERCSRCVFGLCPTWRW